MASHPGHCRNRWQRFLPRSGAPGKVGGKQEEAHAIHRRERHSCAGTVCDISRSLGRTRHVRYQVRPRAGAGTPGGRSQSHTHGLEHQGRVATQWTSAPQQALGADTVRQRAVFCNCNGSMAQGRRFVLRGMDVGYG